MTFSCTNFSGYVRHVTIISLNFFYRVLFSSRFRARLDLMSGWLVVMHTHSYYILLSLSLSLDLVWLIDRSQRKSLRVGFLKFGDCFNDTMIHNEDDIKRCTNASLAQLQRQQQPLNSSSSMSMDELMSNICRWLSLELDRSQFLLTQANPNEPINIYSLLKSNPIHKMPYVM